MRTNDGYPLYIGKEKYINDQRFDLVSRRWAGNISEKLSNTT